MPGGKPAGVPCAQLDDALRCRLFGRAGRPACCAGLAPSAEMCGASREAALAWLARLEDATRPAGAAGGTAQGRDPGRARRESPATLSDP